MAGMFNRSSKVGNEVDMYAGQCKAKIENAILTLKQSDMIEMQFNTLAQLAKQMNDPTMVMQFEMLKGMIDNMQNQATVQLKNAIADLEKIDEVTNKIQ